MYWDKISDLHFCPEKPAHLSSISFFVWNEMKYHMLPYRIFVTTVLLGYCNSKRNNNGTVSVHVCLLQIKLDVIVASPTNQAAAFGFEKLSRAKVPKTAVPPMIPTLK